MKSSAALCLLLAVSASASTISVPLKKVTKIATRNAHLKPRDSGGPTDVKVTNPTHVRYIASVGIGSPARYYDLIVDSGSANTWCGAGTNYSITSTSIPTGSNMFVKFAGGNHISGPEYLDQVTLAPGLVIKNQSIGDAIVHPGFEGVDGVLGLGPADLTVGTLTSDKKETIPTVLNNLKAQNLIDHEVLGVYYEPESNNGDQNGVLTFGGTDPSLYTSDLTYTSITKAANASRYWGIDVSLVTYGNTNVATGSIAGVVQTDSPLVGFVGQYFKNYLSSIPNATTGLEWEVAVIPEKEVLGLQPLKYTIAGREFTLDASAQVFSAEVSKELGAPAGTRYGTVYNLDTLNKPGIDFTLGSGFVERYYTVFDAENQRIGFAETKNTFSTSES